MVLKLLGKGIRQVSEAAHRHSHRQVRALDVGRADILLVGGSEYFMLLAADARRWAVTGRVGATRAVDVGC
jgi:hypothetical protein